jgi:septum site-determining protein MinD
MTKTIGIISIKGGVGKTSCTASLGAALAYQFNKKVLLIDANFSAPNLGLHFGLTDPKHTIHDVLTNQVSILNSIHEFNENLHIIPARLISRKINPFQLKQRLMQIKNNYDIVIIDSSPNLNEEMLATMIASDELYVITAPDYPTLSTTLRAIQIAKQRKTPIKGLILNRVKGKNFELSIEDIEEASDVPVLGVLPEDNKVPEAIYNTTPLAYFNPAARSNYEFNKIAATIINENYSDPRFSHKIKRAFGMIGKEEINREVLNGKK